ncbi:MAG: hypothetical protein ACRDQC_04660 [Gaiellales bacterium]
MRSLLGGGRAAQTTSPAGGPGLQEALVAWAVWGVVAVGVWETYARFPPIELYNVTRSGFAGGAARTLVFLDWPVAIAAVAIVVVAADRILAGPASAGVRWGTTITAAAAIALSATIALPDVLDPDHLDAHPRNLPAAVGVLLAFGLTLVAVWLRGAGPREPLTRGDLLAIAVVPVLIAIALPWILAGAGLYTGDVPVLDDIYVSKAIVPEPGEPALVAVHLGNHEGIDGILLAATAFGLRRPLRRMRPTVMRPLLGAYLALIAVYGLAVAADDFWLEQLQKRGTVSRGLPYVLTPGPRPAWAALLAVAAVVYVVAFRVGNDPGSSTARR